MARPMSPIRGSTDSDLMVNELRFLTRNADSRCMRGMYFLGIDAEDWAMRKGTGTKKISTQNIKSPAVVKY